MFKKCAMCGTKWEKRSDFLNDPNVKIFGYQVSFLELEAGAFLFNHSCGTSMSIIAEQFIDLYEGPLFSDRKTQTELCPELCLNEKNLERCPVKCECAYVREVLQIVKKWEKDPGVITSGKESDIFESVNNSVKQ